MAASPANSHGNGYPLGLAGAVLATRFVGGTATVAPTTGTFLVGDFVIGRNGTLFVCTVAGSPGTWVQVGAGGSGTVTSVTATDASVVVAGTATDPTIATAALNTIAGLKAMSGAIAMNAQKITGLANGAAAADAAAWGQLSRTLSLTQSVVANATTTQTVQASADTLLTSSAITYDGATAILIQFSAANVNNSGAAACVFNLWEDSTDLGRIAQHLNVSGANDSNGAAIITPSAGSHTYTIRWWVTAGTGTVFANSPVCVLPILRLSKVVT